MSTERLHELLEKVHGELRRADAVSDEDRALLRTVMSDIQEKLAAAPPTAAEPASAAPAGEAGDHADAIDRLQDAMWRLEEAHPSLTSALGQLIDALGRTIR